MKIFKRNSYFLLVVIFAGLFLNSCKKNDEPTPENYEYFISNELKTTITTAQAVANFTKLSTDAANAANVAYLITSVVEVHKLIYKTTFHNNDIEASGLVCMPKTAGNYPVLSFQNGTNTLHSMAPTEAVDDDLYSTIESLASMGFIVVIPDYIGFGASPQLEHPYLDKQTTTQSILDLIRAAKEFGTEDQIAAKPTTDLFLFGYSQGGWATLALQKTIEENYTSEFNLIASSCGAGPYSIENMNNYINSLTTYQTPYFLAYLLNSYHSSETVNEPLSDYFQEPYASKIPGLFDGNHSGSSIDAELTTNLDNLLTSEFRTEFDSNTKFDGLRNSFSVNSVTAWNISTPTHLYHGEEDQVIPFSISQTMFDEFKTAGVPDSKIQLIPIPGANHTSGVDQFGMQTILWFLPLRK